MASTAVTKFGTVRAKVANASMSTTLMVGLAGDSIYNSCSTKILMHYLVENMKGNSSNARCTMVAHTLVVSRTASLYACTSLVGIHVTSTPR